jgi:hypothetical protein
VSAIRRHSAALSSPSTTAVRSRGRVLDLSLGAARALGLESRGLGRVHADVL